MAGSLVGVVTSIDRVNHLAHVALPASGIGPAAGVPARRPITPAKYLGSPPPPLSYVEIRQVSSGIWHVLGFVGNKRGDNVHDDFGGVSTGASYGDTYWLVAGAGSGLAGPSDRNVFGSLWLQSGAVTNDWSAIIKAGAYMDGVHAVWLSASIAVSETTLHEIEVGLLSDSGYTHGAYFVDDTTQSTVRFATTNSFSTTFTDFPGGLSAQLVFRDIDIILMPDQFAAMWVDGAGPVISTGNIPPTSGQCNAWLEVFTRTNARRGVVIDWIHQEAFTPVAHPLRDLALPESGIVA